MNDSRWLTRGSLLQHLLPSWFPTPAPLVPPVSDRPPPPSRAMVAVSRRLLSHPHIAATVPSPLPPHIAPGAMPTCNCVPPVACCDTDRIQHTHRDRRGAHALCCCHVAAGHDIQHSLHFMMLPVHDPKCCLVLVHPLVQGVAVSII